MQTKEIQIVYYDILSLMIHNFVDIYQLIISK